MAKNITFIVKEAIGNIQKHQAMRNKLQSRREFFKITAKRVLPVIGLLSIANIPLYGDIIENTDCNHSCEQSCTGTHKGMCSSCSSQCRGTCECTSSNAIQSHTQDTIIPKNDTIKGQTGCNEGCNTTCVGTCLGHCQRGCDYCCCGFCASDCKGSCRGSCYGNCKNHVDLM